MRADDRIRIRLDGGGTLTVTIDEMVPPDRTAHRGMGAWAYDRLGSCYWLDTEDGHAYRAMHAAQVLGHHGRFTTEG